MNTMQQLWRDAITPESVVLDLGIDPPLALRKGERLKCKIQHPIRGNWTWSVATGAERRRHSGFFAQPLALTNKWSSDIDATPMLTTTGSAVQQILVLLNGKRTIDAIAQEVYAQFPNLFPSTAHAQSKVQQIVETYGHM